MKFEHLIEVNDLLNPLLDEISHEQLWRGLVLRAEAPKLFMPQLDECDILNRDDSGFHRKLRFGELVVADRVVLEHMHRVRYLVDAQDEIGNSSLTMTIEVPQPGRLFVRFLYEDDHDAATDEANKMYDEFRKSAYQENDIDTVRILRELAAEGRLDSMMN
jgi:hypothetical protein